MEHNSMVRGIRVGADMDASGPLYLSAIVTIAPDEVCLATAFIV